MAIIGNPNEEIEFMKESKGYSIIEITISEIKNSLNGFNHRCAIA